MTPRSEARPGDVLDLLPAAAAEAARKVIVGAGRMLTDIGNAERLVARYGDRIRYCPPRRRWLLWDGKRWAWDEKGGITQMAKQTVRGIYEEASITADDDQRRAIGKHARESERAARIAAMILMAQSEPGIAVMPSELDANPWLLNCPNGTIDLGTGELRPHNPADMITKTTGVEFNLDAWSEVWERVLHDATGGDDELSAYLRRVFGYSLAGVASERAFFFFYGPPGTLKSTVVEALASALGEYAVTADFDTWCVQRNVGGNRGDLVRLDGARLVLSVEVRRGARWDEAIIKRITGGDEITASAKYEEAITFRPTFTLILAANDAPFIHDDDDGLWARMRRIPFTGQIPPEDQDPRIKMQLHQPEHAAAVLAWAVRGCLEWQRDGLGSCAAVEQSTAEYKEEMDGFGDFLRDCCTFEPDAKVARKELRDAYEDWGRETGTRKLLET